MSVHLQLGGGQAKLEGASARLYALQGEAACIAAMGETQARLAKTEDASEGVRSFVERRDPKFTGR